MKGPDVSAYQGNVDWAKVKAAGFRFAWTKATEGTTYINPTFKDNWAQMPLAGLVRGAYHFAKPSGDPVAQADFFLSVCWPGSPDHVALDLETGRGDLSGWASAWLNRVAQRTSLDPGHLWLYSGDSFYSAHKLGKVPARYRRWIASYGRQPNNSYDMWQYTDAERVPGITNPCDCSLVNDNLMVSVPTTQEASKMIDGKCVAIRATATGHGYWQFTDHGAVYAFGDAPFFGAGNTFAHAPITDVAIAPDGHGCWLTAEDGAVYALGSVANNFYGGANNA